MVSSTQTMHLSCVKISSISNRTITSFHLSLVTYEYHRVCPIRFLSLWYVRRKPCAYLTLTLTLSQTPRNKIPHDPCHLEVPSRVPKTFSEPMVPSAQPCTYLTSRFALPPNGQKRASTRALSPMITIGCVRNDF